MFTNRKACTVYEKTAVNREYIYVRHTLGAVYWQSSQGQRSGSDRIPDNGALVLIPENSAKYVPKVGDRIVDSIIGDERPPDCALTVMQVRDFRYGSPGVRHIEVTAK